MEHTKHPFFLVTLFVPQALSTPESPHPIVSGFLKAATRIAKPNDSADGHPRLRAAVRS